MMERSTNALTTSRLLVWADLEDLCRPKSALLASIVRVKGGKAGAAPAKRGPVEDSSSTQQKWPRIECVQAQASAQPAAVVDGKARQQQPQAAQHRDASDAEPGLAGLLGMLAQPELNMSCQADHIAVYERCPCLTRLVIALACLHTSTVRCCMWSASACPVSSSTRASSIVAVHDTATHC